MLSLHFLLNEEKEKTGRELLATKMTTMMMRMIPNSKQKIEWSLVSMSSPIVISVDERKT